MHSALKDSFNSRHCISRLATIFCICFYCICRGARVELRLVFHRYGRVTAHASRNSAHDGEGEGKRGLGMGAHGVNYTIFAALRVNLRGRFPWSLKVLSTSQPFNLSTFQPFNFSTCLTAAQGAAYLPRGLSPLLQLFNLSTIQPFIFSTCLTAAQGAAKCLWVYDYLWRIFMARSPSRRSA